MLIKCIFLSLFFFIIQCFKNAAQNCKKNSKAFCKTIFCNNSFSIRFSGIFNDCTQRKCWCKESEKSFCATLEEILHWFLFGTPRSQGKTQTISLNSVFPFAKVSQYVQWKLTFSLYKNHSLINLQLERKLFWKIGLNFKYIWIKFLAGKVYKMLKYLSPLTQKFTL